MYELKADSEKNKNLWIDSLRYLLSYNRNKNINPNHQKKKPMLPISRENELNIIQENKIGQEKENISAQNNEFTLKNDIQEKEKFHEKRRVTLPLENEKSPVSEMKTTQTIKFSNSGPETFNFGSQEQNESKIDNIKNSILSKDSNENNDTIALTSGLKDDKIKKEDSILLNEQNLPLSSQTSHEKSVFRNTSSSKETLSKENSLIKKEETNILIDNKENNKSFETLSNKLTINDVFIKESIRKIFNEKATFKFFASKNNNPIFNNKRLIALKKEYLIWYLENENEIPQNILQLEDITLAEIFDDGFQIVNKTF